MGLLNYANEQVVNSRRRRVQVQNRDEVLSRAINTRGLGYFKPMSRQTEIDVTHDVRVNERDSTLPKTVEKSAVVYGKLYGTSRRIMKRAAELPKDQRL